jgi:hypothetical protein
VFPILSAFIRPSKFVNLFGVAKAMDTRMREAVSVAIVLFIAGMISQSSVIFWLTFTQR